MSCDRDLDLEIDVIDVPRTRRVSDEGPESNFDILVCVGGKKGGDIDSHLIPGTTDCCSTDYVGDRVARIGIIEARAERLRACPSS
jgi:hypothetical protein